MRHSDDNPRGLDRYTGRDYDRDWDRERYARDRWDRGYGEDHDPRSSRPHVEGRRKQTRLPERFR